MSQNIDPDKAIDLKNGLILARHDARCREYRKVVRGYFLSTNKGKIQQGQHAKGKCPNLCQEIFQIRHQVLCEGGSQETVAKSEIHGMQGEIKLFVDSNLQNVFLNFCKWIFGY